MEEQIIIMLKKLEDATYGNDNSKHHKHPDAFAFKALAKRMFEVGYSLYGKNESAPKLDVQLFYDMERKLMHELEILCQEPKMSDEQLIVELEPKYMALCSLF